MHHYHESSISWLPSQSSGQRVWILSFYPGLCCTSGKEPAYQCGRHRDTGSIPGSGKSSGEGNGYPLQYSCLGNPKDRGAWWATVYGVAKSCTHTQDILFSEDTGANCSTISTEASHNQEVNISKWQKAWLLFFNTYF